MTVTISSIHGDHEDIRCKAKRFDSAHKMVKTWMSGMYQHFLDADPWGTQYKIEVVGNKATVSMMFRDYDLAGSKFWKVWSDCDNLIDEVHTKYN